MAAGIAAGIYPDYPSAIARTVKITKTVYPDPSRRETYEKKYEVYRKVIGSLAGVWGCFEN